MILPKARWEAFCQGIFEGKTATNAYKEAGFSGKGAYASAGKLLKKAEIQARIKELQEQAVTSKVMTKTERMERLSEIARARYSDFVTAGPDGSWVDIGPEKVNSAAICEVRSRTEYDDNGDKPAVIMSVKLHDPIRAIAELNKMCGDYAPTKTDVTSKGESIKAQTLVVANGNLSSALASLVDAGAVKVNVN